MKQNEAVQRGKIGCFEETWCITANESRRVSDERQGELGTQAAGPSSKAPELSSKGGNAAGRQ
jgi:hypothetical protein